MSTKSIYHKQMSIDPQIKTAVIYSVDHLYVYLVEIKEANTSYYLTREGEPLRFNNLDEARQAAIQERVKQAYLALSKTYEEVDLSTCHADHQDRYDYMKVSLFPEEK